MVYIKKKFTSPIVEVFETAQEVAILTGSVGTSLKDAGFTDDNEEA